MVAVSCATGCFSSSSVRSVGNCLGRTRIAADFTLGCCFFEGSPRPFGSGGDVHVSKDSA
ncbi:hypothetical protein RvY_16281 [Ramazzottius varieornatus]|uniref:Uncharacterized protein n=1 Tax=Ramazzottius varieornatus TaxID=947166 RepID=A0A1D1W0S7_RAMVA|nr:hypothetical protein RvY_16281 [Ramazzottius varieornatus]